MHGNGRKNSSLVYVSISLAKTETGNGFGKENGIKNRWGYMKIRKHTNTDEEPKN
jgi:hypothetical protein